jgi:hypothetical protein
MLVTPRENKVAKSLHSANLVLVQLRVLSLPLAATAVRCFSTFEVRFWYLGNSSSILARPCAGIDISSDLTELGRTRVGVVCAGVKSILNIPRTLLFGKCPENAWQWARILIRPIKLPFWTFLIDAGEMSPALLGQTISAIERAPSQRQR